MQACLRSRSRLSLLPKSTSSLRRLPTIPSSNLAFARFVSNSPYGRTHVWKRRPPVLPNPIVPKFPQKIVRSDGSSFVHWTTSPKSLVRLTRDTTNNPVWNTAVWASESALEEESGTTGRLGRFSRRFGGVTIPTAQTTATKANVKLEGKTERKAERKAEKKMESVKEEAPKETMVDMSSVGMGGVLDDVSWFEQMADLTGGEKRSPTSTKEKNTPKK